MTTRSCNTCSIYIYISVDNARKDSEQIKQIEELQKQNQELEEEKERLLGEIERIDTGNM